MFALPEDFDNAPYTIPKAQEDENLPDFIDDVEEKYLEKLLGIELYNEFIAGLEEDYPEDKWLKIRDGAIYEIGTGTDAKQYKWAGLLTRKGAMVPLIFAEHVRANYDSYTKNSVQIATSENATNISPDLRISRAYNSFADKVGRNCNKKNTLYGLLKTNSTDYPTLNWCDPGSVNIFDL